MADGKVTITYTSEDLVTKEITFDDLVQINNKNKQILKEIDRVVLLEKPEHLGDRPLVKRDMSEKQKFLNRNFSVTGPWGWCIICSYEKDKTSPIANWSDEYKLPVKAVEVWQIVTDIAIREIYVENIELLKDYVDREHPCVNTYGNAMAHRSKISKELYDKLQSLGAHIEDMYDNQMKIRGNNGLIGWYTEKYIMTML